MFPSTHWTEIRKAGKLDEDRGREALGQLLTRYQPALLAYAVTRFGANEDQARDLFQGFVETPVLKRHLITRARPMPGHQFRSYLLRAWHTFICQEFRREHRLKRRPPGGWQPLPESPDEGVAPAVEMAPEVFDVGWARAVLAQARERMRAECASQDRAGVWGVFEARVYLPTQDGVAPAPYEQLVARFGLESPTQARNLLTTGKRMFARCLRAVVGEYVVGEPAVEAELRELQIILGRAE